MKNDHQQKSVKPMEYDNLQSTVLVLLVIGLYSYLYKYSKKEGSRFASNLPPGPPRWPILGNLPSLSLHSERDMFEWNKKYGPVCHLKMASTDFIILGTLEAVQEAFVKKCETFSNRMQNVVPGLSGVDGIACSNWSEKLKKQRKYCISTLKNFGMGRKSIEANILKECSILCDKIKIYSTTEKTFSIDFMLYEAFSGVICHLAFGKNILQENKEFRKFIRSIAKSSSTLNSVMIFCPLLKVIPPFSWIRQETDGIENAVLKILNQEIESHKIARDPDKPRDFIDCFLNEMDKPNAHLDGFYHLQLVLSIRDIFYAGTETGSNTVAWLILYLCRYPEIQRKMQNEISEVLSEERQLSMSASEDMHYTKAVIQETMRIRPVTPIGIPHVAAKEDTIMGYKIPKGAVVASNLFRIHNDETIWSDSECFRPERHLDQNGKFRKSPYVIPYSIGARHCLGQQLGNTEIFLFVVSIFKTYSLTVKNIDSINMHGKNIVSLRPCNFEVTASERYR
ncbi:cytochrome P450 2J4-like [Styela clava]